MEPDLTYDDMLKEFKLFGLDKGDPWGSTLMTLFTVAAELHWRDPDYVPTELEYHPPAVGDGDPRESEDYFYELCERCDTPDLQKFAKLLDRLKTILDKKGLSY